MSRMGQRLCIVLLSLILGLSGLPARFALAKVSTSPLAASLDADFAVDWMQTIYDRVKADKADAPSASRIYAYAGLTLYQSVVDGIPGDVSLSTQIKGLPVLPALETGAVYDWPSVANSALQTVVDSLLT